MLPSDSRRVRGFLNRCPETWLADLEGILSGVHSPGRTLPTHRFVVVVRFTGGFCIG